MNKLNINKKKEYFEEIMNVSTKEKEQKIKEFLLELHFDLTNDSYRPFSKTGAWQAIGNKIGVVNWRTIEGLATGTKIPTEETIKKLLSRFEDIEKFKENT